MKQQPDLTVLGKKTKIYRATLVQSLTGAPVATVIQNDWDGEVVWSRVQTGQYRATFPQILIRERTQVIMMGQYQNYLITGGWNSDYTVQIMTEFGWSGNASDSMMSYTFIEIVEYLTT